MPEDAAQFATEVDDMLEASQAPEDRRTSCLEQLKSLQTRPVTTHLLSESQAGRKLKGLVKHSDAEIAAAAQRVVSAWKEAVRKEAADGHGSSKRAAPAATVMLEPPSAKRQKSDSSLQPNGSGTDGLTADGSSQLSNEQVAAAKDELQMPNVGDRVRNKSVEKILDGLLIARDEVPDADPVQAAVDVEKALFFSFNGVSEAYKKKLLSLVFNLKDRNNPDLRRKVLAGELNGHILVTLSPEELASDARRQENREIKEHAMFEANPAGIKQATTDAFKCGKCKQKKCTYYQMQTRSADEPMTTFVTCIVCNNRWKFC